MESEAHKRFEKRHTFRYGDDQIELCNEGIRQVWSFMLELDPGHRANNPHMSIVAGTATPGIGTCERKVRIFGKLIGNHTADAGQRRDDLQDCVAG
jgi:hypothetical protein